MGRRRGHSSKRFPRSSATGETGSSATRRPSPIRCSTSTLPSNCRRRSTGSRTRAGVLSIPASAPTSPCWELLRMNQPARTGCRNLRSHGGRLPVGRQSAGEGAGRTAERHLTTGIGRRGGAVYRSRNRLALGLCRARRGGPARGVDIDLARRDAGQMVCLGG